MTGKIIAISPNLIIRDDGGTGDYTLPCDITYGPTQAVSNPSTFPMIGNIEMATNAISNNCVLTEHLPPGAQWGSQVTIQLDGVDRVWIVRVGDSVIFSQNVIDWKGNHVLWGIRRQ